MTNEQLAVLLMKLAERVRAVAAEIEPIITDGEYVTKRVWAGEGKSPAAVLGIEDVMHWRTSPKLDEANWREERGRPLACLMVEALADDLQTQADALLGRDA